jgi:serine/threonine-protein kinase
VAAALDGYRDRWRAMSIEACQAGRVRHEQSAELFDLRMECLAQRRASAGALTELFTHADPATVERSVAAAQSLESLDACASVATLRAADPLPRAPDRRARIEALRGKLADVEARERIGRYAEALKAVGPLADEAIAIGWNPLTAQALLARGRLETTAYQFQPARKTLADAAAAAMAGHEDRTLAQIYIALVRASFDSFDKGLQEQAEQWLALASAWIDRLGNTDSLRLQLLDAQGREMLQENRIDEAGQVFQRAMELERKLGDQVGVGSTLDDLGVMLGKKGRRKEARAMLEQSATVLTQALGPRHPKTAVPVYVLAALLKDEGDLDVAEAAARRVLGIYAGALPDGHGRTLAAHNLLGEILLQEGRFDEALTQFRTSMGKRRPGDQGAALDRIGAAIALDRLGKRDEALSTLETALQTTTEPLHRGMVLVERGDVRLRGGQAAPSLADATAALALFEAPGRREPELLIWALTSVGKAQLALHAPAQALPPLERAATLEPEVPPLATARVDAALARALVASHGDAARARRLAEGAAARLEPIGAEGAREANEVRAWMRDAMPRP